MRRKLLSLLLSVFIVLGTLPIYVSADSGDGLKYIYVSVSGYTFEKSEAAQGCEDDPVAIYIDDSYDAGDLDASIFENDIAIILHNANVEIETTSIFLSNLFIMGSGSLTVNDELTIYNPEPNDASQSVDYSDPYSIFDVALLGEYGYKRHAAEGTISCHIMDDLLQVEEGKSLIFEDTDGITYSLSIFQQLVVDGTITSPVFYAGSICICPGATVVGWEDYVLAQDLMTYLDLTSPTDGYRYLYNKYDRWLEEKECSDNHFRVWYELPAYGEEHPDIFNPDGSIEVNGTQFFEEAVWDFVKGEPLEFTLSAPSWIEPEEYDPAVIISDLSGNIICSSLEDNYPDITIDDDKFTYTPVSDAFFQVDIGWTEVSMLQPKENQFALMVMLSNSGVTVSGTDNCVAYAESGNTFKFIYDVGDIPSLEFTAEDGKEISIFSCIVGNTEYYYSLDDLEGYMPISDLMDGNSLRYSFDPCGESYVYCYVTVDLIPAPTGVEGFVDRCYSVILGREPDEAGKANWVSALNNGTNCGAQVAYGFIFSQEYINKNKSNTEFVTDLYLMFFGRNPDSAGLINWLNQLNAGVMTREQVFASFAKSAEYKNICSDYGILQGCYVPGYSTAAQTQVNLFVYRLYNTCLGRNADIGGLENWSRNILAGNTSGYSAALGFFTSTEYKNLNKSDEEFIKDLYTVMMDRNADAAGLENWVKQLTVYSREEVIKMFCKSTEFRNICARYGINVGV